MAELLSSMPSLPVVEGILCYKLLPSFPWPPLWKEAGAMVGGKATWAWKLIPDNGAVVTRWSQGTPSLDHPEMGVHKQFPKTSFLGP